MGIKKLIKSYDKYGSSIGLNFNQKGSKVNTIGGGIVTILI